MGMRVEKAWNPRPRAGALRPGRVGVELCTAGGSAIHLWCPHSQALVDDTEDVSLDFRNEEELAFRKAKIRYVWTGFGQASPKAINSFIYVHSLTRSFIYSQCIEHLVSERHGLGTHPGPDQTKSLPSWILQSGGQGREGE